MPGTPARQFLMTGSCPGPRWSSFSSRGHAQDPNPKNETFSLIRGNETAYQVESQGLVHPPHPPTPYKMSSAEAWDILECHVAMVSRRRHSADYTSCCPKALGTYCRRVHSAEQKRSKRSESRQSIYTTAWIRLRAS